MGFVVVVEDNIVRYYFFFILFVILIKCNWAVTAFVPERGFVYPDFIEGVSDAQAIGNVFENPAAIYMANSTQLKVDTTTALFGYNSYTVSTVVPFSNSVLGLGYYYYGATDLIQTAYRTGEKPINLGGGTHAYTQLRLAYAALLISRVSYGFSIEELKQTLFSHKGHGFSGDLGICYYGDYFWAGTYSRYFFPFSWVWEDSSYKDKVEPSYIVELGSYYKQFSGKIGYDFRLIHLFGNYKLHRNLSLKGDSVIKKEGGILRYGFGLLLDFQPIALQYNWVKYNNVDMNMHQVGFLYRLRK